MGFGDQHSIFGHFDPKRPPQRRSSNLPGFYNQNCILNIRDILTRIDFDGLIKL